MDGHDPTAVTDIEATTPPPRLVALDVMRGLTVALMILVNNPGSWSHIHPPLRHAAWHGWTPTDLVFPFFLFVVGVAVSLSFRRRLAQGGDRAALVRKVLMRTVVIFGLGLLLNGFPYDNLGALRLWGVLQRIAICYLITGLTVVLVPRRAGRFAVALGLVAAYELLMRLPLVAGWGHGSFALADNFVRRVDLLWPGAVHLYQGTGVPFDPEGLVSSLTAAAGTLAGFAAGEFLGRELPLTRRLGGLAAAGVLGAGLGLLLGAFEPINKQLWTTSYTVLMTGLALVALAVCGWAVDVRGWRRWTGPAVVFGTNPLLAFVGSGLVARALVLIRLPVGDGTTVALKTFIYSRYCASWAGPTNGSLVFALLTIVLWWGALALLHRRGIHLRV